jgi:diaminopimelate epimerase
MSDINFTKAQGMGNDFLIIEVDDIAELQNASELARAMCQRNYGAGADGIVFVTSCLNDHADFASRIFNADGSEAGVSGNGTRCAAAYFYHARLWNEPEIRIATVAGVKHGRLVSREGTRFEFEFDMGRPILSSDAVPMSIMPSIEQVVRYPLNLGGDLLEVTCMSMGNPQCVIFVTDLNAVNLEEIGPLIEHHPIFPDRANVEFAHALSRDEIEIRIWERGAGHTLSSGTGSCASAVAGALNGLTDRNVRVLTEGGELQVDWTEDDRVMLTASAEVIYEGRWLSALRLGGT